MAEDLARRGIAVVLTPAGRPEEIDGQRVPATLAADLHRAGVAIAIGSGNADRARFLPLLAAACAGAGLPESAAERAITLTAAELLGIAGETGSLEPGKRADVLITSAPMLRSDARVLCVLADGATVYQGR
jgi:imidazolonepropionase-like amidohydrolase